MEELNERILRQQGTAQANDGERVPRVLTTATGNQTTALRKEPVQGESRASEGLSKESDGLASKGGHLHEQIRPEIWGIWKEIGYKLKGLAPKLLTGTQLEEQYSEIKTLGKHQQA